MMCRRCAGCDCQNTWLFFMFDRLKKKHFFLLFQTGGGKITSSPPRRAAESRYSPYERPLASTSSALDPAPMTSGSGPTAIEIQVQNNNIYNFTFMWQSSKKSRNLCSLFILLSILPNCFKKFALECVTPNLPKPIIIGIPNKGYMLLRSGRCYDITFIF